MSHKWEIEYWKDGDGRCPVCEFMHDLYNNDSVGHALVREKIKRFQTWEISQVMVGDLEDIGNRTWEFKINVARRKVRMLGRLYRDEGPPRFLAVHAFLKKRRRLTNKDIKIAINRLKGEK